MEEAAPKESPKSEVNTMAILSYLGPLCLIPFFTEKKDEFVKFHIKQGMVLLICEAVIWLVSSLIFSSIGWSWGMWGILGMLGMLQSVAYLCLGVLSIVGIINVINGEKKELPVIGKFAEKITFVK